MESADLVVGSLFLSFGSSGFPAKTKSVDDHGSIVIWPAVRDVTRVGYDRWRSGGCNVQDTIDDGGIGEYGSGV
jgi:hypothetical protein